MPKALSVKQPWGQLIIHGALDRHTGVHVWKDVENRRWKTKHRGLLCIHASQSFDSEAYEMLRTRYDFALRLGMFPMGCMLGEVEMYDCISQRKPRRSTWHEHGLVGWYFKKPVVYRNQIEYKGQLGLWDFPEARRARCLAKTDVE